MERLKIVGLMSHAGAGKDTVGKMMCEMADGVRLSFAGKLKEVCGELFGLSCNDMNTEEGKNRPLNLPCLMCPQCKSLECEQFEMDKSKMGTCKICGSIGDIVVYQSFWTPRMILQYVGTTGIRKIDQMAWVRYAMNKAQAYLTIGHTTDLIEGPLQKATFVVLTDCRFKSEASAIWSAGGEVWRIKRPSTDEIAQGIVGHPSEVEQDSIPDRDCQAVIVNDSTLDALRANVSVQLQRFLARP